MEPKELPPLWVRKIAADMANAEERNGNPGITPDSVQDYYTGLALCRLIAKYEKPPVDEAELKRRQDAREAAATVFDRYCNARLAREARSGEKDDSDLIRAAYIALCHRDGTQPIPVEEWSK
jgi:hypothetical protein